MKYQDSSSTVVNASQVIYQVFLAFKSLSAKEKKRCEERRREREEKAAGRKLKAGLG